jgi:hypothetical protein
MENSKIIVSNPCNKDWSKMSSTENGRHCISCNKTVVDFTNWKQEVIVNYLEQTNKKTCGHFKSSQVTVKRPRHHQFLVDAYYKTENNFKSSYFKSFLLSTIIALMFLVGCNNPNGREGTITGLRVVDHPRFSDKDSLSTNNAKSFQNQNEKP